MTCEIIEKKTILVVDDELGTRDFMKYCIQRGGHEVLEATSAESALELIANVDVIDLIIADHIMPGMKGLDLIKQIRAEGHTTHVWLVSEHMTDEIKVSAIECGATKALSKNELIATLQEEKFLPMPTKPHTKAAVKH